MHPFFINFAIPTKIQAHAIFMKYKQITFIVLSLLLTATASQTCCMSDRDQLASRELSDSEAEELCDLFASQSLDEESDEILFFNADHIEKEREEKQLRNHLTQQKEFYAELAGFVTQKKCTILSQKKSTEVLKQCKWALVIHHRREIVKRQLEGERQELQQKLLYLGQQFDHTEARFLKRQKIDLEEKMPSTRRRSSRKRQNSAAPYSSYTSSFSASSKRTATLITPKTLQSST